MTNSLLGLTVPGNDSSPDFRTVPGSTRPRRRRFIGLTSDARKSRFKRIGSALSSLGQTSVGSRSRGCRFIVCDDGAHAVGQYISQPPLMFSVAPVM